MVIFYFLSLFVLGSGYLGVFDKAFEGDGFNKDFLVFFKEVLIVFLVFL